MDIIITTNLSIILIMVCVICGTIITIKKIESEDFDEI